MDDMNNAIGKAFDAVDLMKDLPQKILDLCQAATNHLSSPVVQIIVGAVSIEVALRAMKATTGEKFSPAQQTVYEAIHDFYIMQSPLGKVAI
jgi:hypothetical protein